MTASGFAGELPPEHACPAFGEPSPGSTAERVAEGMVLARADLLRLSALLPPEVWRHRDAFFHEEMRMAIGACHRRYPVPSAYRLATERFAGRARLDADGNLTGYTAGLPFPPETIDGAGSDAGARWAWNAELRNRGAGPSARFRITEWAGAGDEEISQGSWFQHLIAHRADLALPGAPAAGSAAWVAGGRFAEPADARGVAWQQTRAAAAAQRFGLPDDVFVFTPALRKVRRASTAWVDGLYLPRHRAPGGVIGAGGVAAAGAAASLTENAARGFTGLEIRPNAYVWRVLGVREVIAPLNAARGGYPSDPDRDFGPSGLSLADDRWDVRQAVAIQGALRETGRDYDWLTLYVDTQTQQPLYVIAERRSDHRAGVGILLHRWSGDRPGYPAWPGGEPASVFDPAAEVFFDERDGSAWRRESFDAQSIPIAEDELRYRTSSAFLERPR
ncbi:MAG TPA: DUF1329 domain-containing protein [Myxococcota bacterium]|nr:DUF1329 domain-containing protein [Myxococcota bacterium]